MGDDLEQELGLSEPEGVGILELARELSLHGFSPKGISRKMRDALENPDTPPNVKHSINALAIKVFSQASALNNKTDFQSMSREELVEYIQRTMKRHDNQLPEVFIGATNGPAIPAVD